MLDDQREKQRKFMPGGQLPVMPHDALYSAGIDMCLRAVNAESEAKVIGKHLQWVQDGGVFLSILPPSPRPLPVRRASQR
jgi:hypothetical protein